MGVAQETGPRHSTRRVVDYGLWTMRNSGFEFFKAEAKMHKYEIIIYWSREDQVFVVEVPELAGRMAHGDGPESALANANQAIQLWIDTAREFGDPIPEPKGERLILA